MKMCFTATQSSQCQASAADVLPVRKCFLDWVLPFSPCESTFNSLLVTAHKMVIVMLVSKSP